MRWVDALQDSQVKMLVMIVWMTLRSSHEVNSDVVVDSKVTRWYVMVWKIFRQCGEL